MVEIIVAALSSLGIGGIITHLFMNKKYKAEAQATVSDEALKLVQSLQGELVLIKTEVQELRIENIRMHKQIAVLEGMLAFYKELPIEKKKTR